MATSINNPQLIWIQGRCHRINPTTDKENVDLFSRTVDTPDPDRLGAYQEPDLYGEDDRDFDEIQLINDKFISTISIPS